MSTPLAIASALHPAYAPQYVARALGLFEAQGLAVTLMPQPAGSSAIVETLRSGTADLVLGSVLFALRAADEGLDPVLVAQSNQQVRHALLAREAEARPLAWSELAGRSVLVFPNPVPTPWVAFRAALGAQGLGLDAIRPIIGYGAAEAVSEFRRGVGHLLLADPESIALDGLREVARVADALGPVPWSVYCATRRAAARLALPLDGFRLALAGAIDWLYGHDGATAARLLAADFPQRPADLLAADFDRAIAARLWPPGARLMDDQLDRWQAALMAGGLLDPPRTLTAMLPRGTDR